MKMETAGYLKIDRLALGLSPTVPMHLGLIDRPFVPHNLISAQESPVPLPKFQMAPRYTILFTRKKSQQMNSLQVPQQCPYGEIPAYRAFLCLS